MNWINNLQEFLNWTVEKIREDKQLSPWLEERKFDWAPLVANNIKNILEKNYSVLIITDSEREWFLNYILTKINSKKLNRPFLPFYDFRAFFKQIDSIKSEDDISNIRDMLNISFPNGYCFWYIGKSQDTRSSLAKITKSSFLWIFDEERQGSIALKSSDDGLDIKLLQMFRLYSKTLSAALFAEISMDF